MASQIASMTGFARTDGVVGRLSWVWELRGVNARGLDFKLRLPPGFEALEPELRAAAGQVRRGTVTANLSVQREQQTRIVLDEAALAQVMALAVGVAKKIGADTPRAEALLALPGVLRAVPGGDDEPDALPAVRDGFLAALAAFGEMRLAEGARLRAVLTGLLDQITADRAEAEALAAEQPRAQQARLMEVLAGLTAGAGGLPEARIAQEVALLASRADIREELDRLAAHAEAAGALLAEGGAVGRKLDFLAQELHREANTLCAKSASVALTAAGIRLKAAIEQVREQVQNIE